MTKSNITVHTMVKNEEQWIWFALMSVVEFVDKILIFDNGSTDKTLEIIKSIENPKIVFEEKGDVNAKELTALRNEQLKKTKTQWFILLDGDEVWPKSAVKRLIDEKDKVHQDIWALVNRTRNCVGDLWHYQPEIAGKYFFLGKQGHFNIRLYRKIPGFYWRGNYPDEAYVNSRGIPLQNMEDHLKFVDIAYWHLTHLKRSSKSLDVEHNRVGKYKLEIGKKALPNELPEVFFAKRPSFVSSPWVYYNFCEKILAYFLTPIRFLKRILGK